MLKTQVVLVVAPWELLSSVLTTLWCLVWKASVVQDQDQRTRSAIGAPLPKSELWIRAVYMFERYGEAAQNEVIRRADEMSMSGDIAGEATWTAIGHYLNDIMNRPIWMPARRIN